MVYCSGWIPVAPDTDWIDQQNQLLCRLGEIEPGPARDRPLDKHQLRYVPFRGVQCRSPQETTLVSLDQSGRWCYVLRQGILLCSVRVTATV